jgi:hypothetical protein
LSLRGHYGAEAVVGVRDRERALSGSSGAGAPKAPSGRVAYWPGRRGLRERRTTLRVSTEGRRFSSFFDGEGVNARRLRELSQDKVGRLVNALGVERGCRSRASAASPHAIRRTPSAGTRRKRTPGATIAVLRLGPAPYTTDPQPAAGTEVLKALANR